MADSDRADNAVYQLLACPSRMLLASRTALQPSANSVRRRVGHWRRVSRTERSETHVSGRRSLFVASGLRGPTALNWPQTRSQKLPAGPFCGI
eukprot:957181-Alexandrium_andersonii.AAC.1